jgi:ribonuclease Z
VPKIIILGSSNAVPSKDHENTHLVIIGKERTILVDCVSDPIVRLEQAGVDFNELTDIVITHFHPDHVSGVPLLLMDIWLKGPTKPINN